MYSLSGQKNAAEQAGDSSYEVYKLFRQHNMYQVYIDCEDEKQEYSVYMGTAIFVKGSIMVMPQHFCRNLVAKKESGSYDKVNMRLVPSALENREQKSYLVEAYDLANRTFHFIPGSNNLRDLCFVICLE
jgi:hypothetical protein